MKLTTALVALSATAVLAAPATDMTINKRATTGVYVISLIHLHARNILTLSICSYLCNDRNWQGYCVHINSAPSVCVPLAGDLNDLVSSAGPDKGSFCYFFVDPNCSTNADFFHVGNPGVADLSKTPVNGAAGSTRNFEDKLSSYYCVNDS
jgi:hypothetical protein